MWSCALEQKMRLRIPSKLSQIHDGVIGIKCEVGLSSHVDDLIKKSTDAFNRIDILINNAGIFCLKRLVDTTEEEWDQTLNSNLKSAFLCSKAGCHP